MAICSVSMAPASRNISTLTPCQQIGNLFVSMAPASRNISTLTSCQQIWQFVRSHGSSFTEYQHTHFLSTDWQFCSSAWLQLHGISAHSLTCHRLAICFGQHGSSFTEYQHTHETVNRLAFCSSAWLQLHGDQQTDILQANTNIIGATSKSFPKILHQCVEPES